MSKKIQPLSRFIGGIAEFDQESTTQSGYAMGVSIDVRTDPNTLTILPKTVKESQTVITDLPHWMEYVDLYDKTYIYGATGNIYSRDSSSTYALLHTASDSHGNGLSYFGEDDSLYYTTDTTVGRYGALGGSPTFVDDYFGSQGGTPLNTYSIDLEASSSQYLSRADTSSLSITGDLTIEAQINMESLPTAGNSMTIVGKWDESGTTKSYKYSIDAVAAFFGDGSDGALTISSPTTQSPIDSACTGTSGSTSLSATNASFSAGQQVLIHQTRGTGAGQWMRNTIQSYTTGTITLEDSLNADYVSGAQVIVMPQYTDVTVSDTWTAKAWDGTVGGILTFLYTGTFSGAGTITAAGKGFRGGAAVSSISAGYQGEGTAGASGTKSTAANGNGGGGGGANAVGSAGGGGGGHSAVGTTATSSGANVGGSGGSTAGSADLTTLVFGGGGGTGGAGQAGGSGSGTGGTGGNGGGIIFAIGATDAFTGTASAGGSVGGNGSGTGNASGGGGGAGGSLFFKSQTATLGTLTRTATGGAGGAKSTTGAHASATAGAAGAGGRIHLDYYTSYSGTTNPTLDVAQDNSLVSSTTYYQTLQISNDGSTEETYQKAFDISTGMWAYTSVEWDASASTAEFFKGETSLGTAVGSMTSIHDNASTLDVGAYENSGGSKTAFFDGKMDELRLWNKLIGSTQRELGINNHINAASAGLVAYYHFNNAATDSTANANNLTASGSPVYVTDVPFSAPTTRLDIDQSAATSGNTYTLTTAINEGATHRKTFTPARDPQKSIDFNVTDKGTGDWTVTIHDSNNNEIATSTITNANMTTGYVEFVYTSVWRPLTNFTNDYHVHITSTVADGTVETTTTNDLETVDFHTYFQFLIEEEWHPIAQMLQFLVFGNERYVGKLEATDYNPNYLVLPAGWHVRCFDVWQEYLAIGVVKGSDVKSTDIGRVYFWDGIAETYNFYIPVAEGGVTAMKGAGTSLYIWAGYHSTMLKYTGGASAERIRNMPKLKDENYAEMYPAAVCVWQSLLRFGFAGETDSTDIYQAVYSWGSTTYKYADILTCDYPISTGITQSTTVQIGALAAVNRKLLIGWKSGTGYGVDYVDPANDCFSSAFIELLVQDGSGVWHEKQVTEIGSKFLALTSGQTITLSYKKDDDAAYTNTHSTTSSSDEVTSLRFLPADGRFYDLYIRCDIDSTSGASPSVKSIVAEIESHESSSRLI